MKPWEAEYTVSVEEARALLGTARVEPFGQGWDNTVYLADGEWVVRFPRRAIAVPLIELETRVLPLIAPELPLPVPVPSRTGLQGNGWPFAGYRKLDGTTADRADLDDDSRARAAAPLGSFLRALHSIELEGLPGDTLGRADLKKRVPATLERLHALRLPEVARLQALVEECAVEVPAPPRPVHGDLYSRHLLVRVDGTPSGVIDWGDLHLGATHLDFGIAWGYLPPLARENFRQAYGFIEERAWLRGRFQAIFHAAATLLYGLDVGDAPLARESRRALDLVLQT